MAIISLTAPTYEHGPDGSSPVKRKFQHLDSRDTVDFDAIFESDAFGEISLLPPLEMVSSDKKRKLSEPEPQPQPEPQPEHQHRPLTFAEGLVNFMCTGDKSVQCMPSLAQFLNTCFDPKLISTHLMSISEFAFIFMNEYVSEDVLRTPGYENKMPCWLSLWDRAPTHFDLVTHGAGVYTAVEEVRAEYIIYHSTGGVFSATTKRCQYFEKLAASLHGLVHSSCEINIRAYHALVATGFMRYFSHSLEIYLAHLNAGPKTGAHTGLLYNFAETPSFILAGEIIDAFRSACFRLLKPESDDAGNRGECAHITDALIELENKGPEYQHASFFYVRDALYQTRFHTDRADYDQESSILTNRINDARTLVHQPMQLPEPW